MTRLRPVTICNGMAPDHQIGRAVASGLEKCGVKPVAVTGAFRGADNRIFALEDKCPRKNGPLSRGTVHDRCVMRPLHNRTISLETGSAQDADDGATLSFPVRVEGRKIFLSLQSGA